MSQDTAQRIRDLIGQDPNIGEIRMFGAICLTLNGTMLCGTMKDSDLLFRVGREQHDAALAHPGARRMDFTGKPMPGFVVISSDAISGAGALDRWIALATNFVGPMSARKKKN